VIERLQAIGCDIAQGYHWSRPVPADQLAEVLARLSGQPATT